MDQLMSKLNRLAFFCMAIAFIAIFTWQATPTFLTGINPILPLVGLVYVLLGLTYISIAMILWIAWIITLLLHLRSRLKLEQQEREIKLKRYQSRFPSSRSPSTAPPVPRVPHRQHRI